MGRVSLNEVFENIKSNDASIIENQRRITKLIDKMKFLKISRSALSEYNLICSPKKPFEIEKNAYTKNDLSENRENFPYIMSDRSFNTIDDGINQEMARMKIDEQRLKSSEYSAEKIRENFERKSKLYTDLYEILRKRKQVPTQSVNLDKLPVLEKTDDLKTMPIVLTDTSFLNLKTQPSPNVSHQQQQQHQQVTQTQQQVSFKKVENIYPSSTQTQPQSNLKIQLPQQQQFKQQMNTPPPSQILPTNLNTVTSTPTVNATFSFNNQSSMPSAISNSKPLTLNPNALGSQQAAVPKNLFPSSNPTDSASKLIQSNTNASTSNNNNNNNNTNNTLTATTIIANTNNKPLLQQPENQNKASLLSTLTTTSTPSPSFSFSIGAKQPQSAVIQQFEQAKTKQDEKLQPQAESKSEVQPAVITSENKDSSTTTSSSNNAMPSLSLFGKASSSGATVGSLFGAASSTAPQAAPFSFSLQKTAPTSQFSFGASATNVANPQDLSSKLNQPASSETTTANAPTKQQQLPITTASLIPIPTTGSNPKVAESLSSSSVVSTTSIPSEQTKFSSIITKGEKTDTATKPTVPTESISTTVAATNSSILSSHTIPIPTPTQPAVNTTTPVPTFGATSVPAPVHTGGLFDATKNQAQQVPPSLFGAPKIATETVGAPKPTGTQLFSGFLPTASVPVTSTGASATPTITNPFSAVAAAKPIQP